MSVKKIAVTPRGFAKCGVENAEIIRKAGFDVVYNDTGSAFTKEEFYGFTKGASGVIVGVETVDRAYIDAHPELKAIVKFGVGTDNIDVEYCRQKGIFVGRTVGSNARSVAETAISFVLADSKNLFDSLLNVKQHGWAKMTGYEIAGRSIGIIGFGVIGRIVAQMAYALGMRVIVYDPYSIDREFANSIEAEITGMEELLERSDFVSLHIPLTPETEGMICEKNLCKMKPSAVLINTSRGGIVNEADLYGALKNKKLRAAYFDVFSTEPPKDDEPLLELPNFYLTPHIASRSAEAEKKTADMATEIIIEALSERQ